VIEEKRITKVKVDGARVEISGKATWGINNEREWHMRCVEEPDPVFPEALQKLVPEIKELLELPSDWADGAMKVISVSFSWAAGPKVHGASICCRADLECANSPLIFNTPHLPYDQYSEGGDQPVMPIKLIELLDEVEAQAERYLAGARAQQNLFDEPRPIVSKDAAAGEHASA
jgi:hypothetical protein